MEKELSIHLKYGTKTCILSTKRSEFLSKAAAKFNLNEEEVEIYEISKHSKKKIGVPNLRDFINVELSTKLPVSTNKINGQRSLEVNKTSSNSIVATMCQKLKENELFTTAERELLYGHLQSLPLSLKRRLECGDPHPAEMKNRKIQANPIDQKLAYTQTDKLIELSRPSTSTVENRVHEEIKRYAKKEKQDPAKTAELMSKTYTERRNFILIQKPMVQFVKEKYPLLFSLSEVRNELDRIFYDGKCEEFIANVEKFAEIVLSLPKEDDLLLKTIRDKQKLCSTPTQKRYAVEVGSILMLSRLTGESRMYLKLEDTSIDPGNLPYIECEATLSEIYSDQYTFKVFTENLLICEACDFKEAILCLLASFFIFNISYPDHAFSTLVIMEKLYLEGNDTEDCYIDENIKQIIKTLELKGKANRK